jgi:hypothetical protein
VNDYAAGNRRVQLILWFAFLQCVAADGIIVYVVSMPRKDLPFDEMSFFTIAISLAFVPHMLSLVYPFKNNHTVPMLVIKLALAETAAIFGLVMYFLFGCGPLSLKAMGISLLSVALLFPSSPSGKTDDRDPSVPPPIG